MARLDSEQRLLYDAYADYKGEIIEGTVKSVEGSNVSINWELGEAVLPRKRQIPGEKYYKGQCLRVYVSKVRHTKSGLQIIVSRAHRNTLRRLFELEVPEIQNGTVEIKGIAREAGSRSKVAVVATKEGVNPLGSCVGMRGERIKKIVEELSGEKVDIVQWDSDLANSVANALSPAKVLSVNLEEDDGGKVANVVVSDNQVTLAIGKEGQNARLAAKLAGCRIDIKGVAQAEQKRKTRATAEEEQKQDLLDIVESLLTKNREGQPATQEEDD